MNEMKTKANYKPKMTNADIRKMVTNKVLECLDRGVNPWRKPWSADGSNMPHNCFSGHEYRGINVFHLWACQMVEEYPTSQWLTYLQAKQLGGCVRKGEKASYVIFTKPLTFKEKDKETGEEKEKNVFMLRVSPVFNIAQCDGVTLPKRETVQREPLSNGELIAAVQRFMADNGAKVNYGGHRACYAPNLDHITLPIVETFHSAEGFASTALHELVHWTGHESRLARVGIVNFGGFGSESYAFEELVAEFGSAILGEHFQIGNSEIENHASYLKHWRDVIAKDSKALFRAARLAECAADYLKPEAQARAA